MCKARESELINQLATREVELTNQMNEAVKDAKSRVYEKAKAQFEAGNKEFLKLKNQYKELSAEKNTLSDTLQNVNTELVSVRSTLVEEKAKESVLLSKISDVRVLLYSLADSVIGERVSANGSSQPSIAIADASASSDLQDKEKVALAQASLAQKRAELISLENNKMTLYNNVVRLEDSLKTTENQLAQSLLRVSVQEEKVVEVEAKLATAQKQLKEATDERDAQMTVLAKLIMSSSATDSSCASAEKAVQLLTSEKGVLEETVSKLKAELAEVTERCIGLRTMNEELLGMLENTYSKVEGQI